MRGKLLAAALLTVLIIIGCTRKESKGEVFGEGVSLEQVVPVAQVLQTPQKFVNQKVRVKGTITACCQHKGCWIALEADGKQLIVRFKDEAFSIPPTSTGRVVDVEGVLLPAGTVVPMPENKEEMENCPEGEKMAPQAKTTQQPETYTMIATGLVLL